MNWIMALARAVGVLAQVTAWVGGPSKGLYQVGLAGNLPPVMQDVYKRQPESRALRAGAPPYLPLRLQVDQPPGVAGRPRHCLLYTSMLQAD